MADPPILLIAFERGADRCLCFAWFDVVCINEMICVREEEFDVTRKFGKKNCGDKNYGVDDKICRVYITQITIKEK